MGRVAILAVLTMALPLSEAAAPPRALRPALASITGEGILRHICVLAADEFEGREPGSPGEDKTVAYLTEQFQGLGLKPGNPDGTYVQAVPLAGYTSRAAASYQTGERRVELTQKTDCVAWTPRLTPEVKIDDSEVVFVGYGVVAPEYGWDDYKGVDVSGKTIVMLINDPAVPDPNDPTKLDERMFKGRAMTYYGRWTYKFEMAARKGAAAALIVHETGPAGYPWEVVVASNSREHFALQAPDPNAGRLAVQGWITLERARKLCAAGGFDFDALKKAAVQKDFKPVALSSKASFTIQNALRQLTSRNVAAKLEGADRQLRNQYVVYTAHWDHLGRDRELKGDQVYHGALDNASGVAGLLELARAFRQLKRPPARSILFLSVTAEEKGLLGAKYYVAHPLYPLSNTVANLNLDGLNPWGRTRDLEVVGFGNSSLEDVLAGLAARRGRTVGPELQPEKGHYYRSDQFEFAKGGVPALYFRAGVDYVGKPKDFGPKQVEEYVAQHYHKVSDQIRPEWDLAGAVEDVQLLFEVGWSVAQTPARPQWKPGAEFGPRRAAGPKAAAARSQ
jgi:Zn-dependent M28 family amino/carboxypeptidase